MKETPNAQQAFEDYYGLGPQRSLGKLHAQYVEREQSGDEAGVPTTRLNTLSDWSSQHNWQERVRARLEQQAAEIRERLQERANQLRENVAGFIVVEISRLLKRLQDAPNEVLTKSTLDLERQVKLFFQLAEQPLAERPEKKVEGELTIQEFIRTVLDNSQRRQEQSPATQGRRNK